ncbi:MAG: hypothetical protein EAZ97_08365 [Bacteroidetes bacterium]|nr:MAG: hypothetical protein EAZ97_08365 [Bacteroidota bacterium]
MKPKNADQCSTSKFIFIETKTKFYFFEIFFVYLQKKMPTFYLSFLLNLFFTHAIHVSISEINYQAKNKSLEISHRIFIDDLEDVLEKEHSEKLFLASPKENPNFEKYLQIYMQKHFQLSINGKKVVPKYVGREYEELAIWVYFEVENIKEIQTIFLKNTILMDLYEDQSNLVHSKYLGQTKSMRFKGNETTDQVSF